MSRSKRRTQVGKKPPVAFDNQNKALDRISSKLEVLTKAIASLGAERIGASRNPAARKNLLEALPKSQATFNAWTSSAAREHGIASAKEFGPNSQAALRNSGLQEAVADAARIVKAMLANLPSETQREETIAALKRERLDAVRLQRIGAAEIIRLKRELHDRDDEIESLQRSLSSTKEKAATVREALESQLRQLQKAARQDPGKVVPLHIPRTSREVGR